MHISSLASMKSRLSVRNCFGTQRKQEMIALIFCFLISTAFIAVNSKNSFLYPMQDWVDVHCFYTVGKSISKGAVLYRDIFEQKGPLLYFFYAWAYRIFPDSFIGVFLMEALSFGAFLYFAVKCIRLYVNRPIILYGMIPLLAFVVTMSEAFGHGGSVEELTLFCSAYTLYSMLCMHQSGKLSPVSLFCNGLCLGFVFWIKFTMIGLWIGVIIAMSVYLWIGRRFTDLFTFWGYGFLGFMVISLPVLIYFLIHGAFADLWDVYFYHNIFLYPPSLSLFERLFRMCSLLYQSIKGNLFYFVPALIGLVWVLWRRNFETILLISAAVCSSVLIFIPGKSFPYYGLPLAVFALFGFAALGDWCRRIPVRKIKIALTAFVAVLALCTPFFSLLIGRNVYFMSVKREDLAQYRFAKIMNEQEAPTLFNYGFLDGGFYYAAELAPTSRYFCTLNVTSPKIKSEIDGYVLEGKTDFVVTRDQRLEEIYDVIPYECIAEESYFFEDINGIYYLYKKQSNQLP